MNPIFFIRGKKALKYELMLTFALLLALFCLPVIALLSITNIPVLAFAGNSRMSSVSIYTDPQAVGDTYDYGYCTYWAALRRIQVGQPIPNGWGDAIDWNFNAILDGYLVDKTPSVNAIMQWPEAPGGEGHVAFVEAVNPTTGVWTISEMNAVGWDEVDEKTMPASAALDYNFIHQKITDY